MQIKPWDGVPFDHERVRLARGGRRLQIGGFGSPHQERRMRAPRMALVLPVVAAFACTTQDAPQDAAEQKSSETTEDVAAVRQAIEAENAKFTAAMEAGDAATAVAIYGPEAVVMMPASPAMRGEAAIREGLGGWLSAETVNDFTLTTGDVMVADDLAIETGTYTMTTTPKAGGAAKKTDQGKYLTVWKKQPDGTWKLIRDIANTDLPMAAH
jgi:uncharacterized protein (TIGR02246 family)